MMERFRTGEDDATEGLVGANTSKAAEARQRARQPIRTTK